MPLRAHPPTAQATVFIPGFPVPMEAAAWSATVTTHATVTSQLLMGRIATTVSAAGYGGQRAIGHNGMEGGREKGAKLAPGKL
jgi:hypothetical protein